MAQQFADGDVGGVGIVGQPIGQRIVERHLALLDELHDQRGDEGLGHRAHDIERRRRGRLCWIELGQAVGVAPGTAVGKDDFGGDARDAVLVALLGKRVAERVAQQDTQRDAGRRRAWRRAGTGRRYRRRRGRGRGRGGGRRAGDRPARTGRRWRRGAREHDACKEHNRQAYGKSRHEYRRYTQKRMSIEPITPSRERVAVSGTRDKVGRPLAVGYSRRALNASERKLEEELAAHYPSADLARGPARRGCSRSRRTAPRSAASGEPYVSHPLAVARILAELGLDPDAIVAALLHDIPEDTDYALTDIEERFGADVAQPGGRRHQAVQVRLVAQPRGAAGREHPQDAAGDGGGHPRRAHQARRPAAQHAHHRRAAARETAAHRAPDGRDLRAAGRAPGHLADQVGARGPVLQGARAGRIPPPGRAARDAAARSARPTSSAPWSCSATRSSKAGIKGELSGRPKHISSIWKKMQRKSAEPVARSTTSTRMRVLVDEVPDCYAALGVVHSHVAADSRPVRRLHRGAQDERLPEPPHRGHRARRQAARGPDPDPRHAPRERDGHRRALALQGRRQGRLATTTPSSPGCAS